MCVGSTFVFRHTLMFSQVLRRYTVGRFPFSTVLHTSTVIRYRVSKVYVGLTIFLEHTICFSKVFNRQTFSVFPGHPVFEMSNTWWNQFAISLSKCLRQVPHVVGVSTDGGSYDYLRVLAECLSFFVPKWFLRSVKRKRIGSECVADSVASNFVFKLFYISRVKKAKMNKKCMKRVPKHDGPLV